jgi:MoaA/NifB/PqqE/SkfB family radical SAM enzyme
MDDLKAFRVPVLILSGGEPLLRPDIFDIARAPRPWASTSACRPTAR